MSIPDEEIFVTMEEIKAVAFLVAQYNEATRSGDNIDAMGKAVVIADIMRSRLGTKIIASSCAMADLYESRTRDANKVRGGNVVQLRRPL